MAGERNFFAEDAVARGETAEEVLIDLLSFFADALPSLALSSALLTMPEDALAAEKPSFNRGPDGRTPFGVPLYRSRMCAAQ